MEQVVFTHGGEVLIAHLAAYGLAVVLESAMIDAHVGHDPDSLRFEPFVHFDATQADAARAVRDAAGALERLIESDVERVSEKNARRSVIWGRSSFDHGSERGALVLAKRSALVAEADAGRQRLASGLLAALGAPALWGPKTVKSGSGATALDGVLGNHTSDFVRGVLRPCRADAADVDEARFLAEVGKVTSEQRDRTNWAPSGTRVGLIDQWLAALGLSMLPVAHRQVRRSATPACWSGGRPVRHRTTLPLLDQPVSPARLRALLSLGSLASVCRSEDGQPDVDHAGALRAFGVTEVVTFDRRYNPGSSSSVAFTYVRGRRRALGASAVG
ncbi:hypothetical protein [Conexibacter arvalis]|uniref:Uncharacterized protein n=1 Tax=Conexibacter arvalis TaxID=912552 RepID=A0A840IEQ5_9ACTN|nr:hypothetical protein [Conexibacter arvalis]MBB4663296.1 hypothetical protein [Conexibacter arvalis]